MLITREEDCPDGVKPTFRMLHDKGFMWVVPGREGAEMNFSGLIIGPYGDIGIRFSTGEGAPVTELDSTFVITGTTHPMSDAGKPPQLGLMNDGPGARPSLTEGLEVDWGAPPSAGPGQPAPQMPAAPPQQAAPPALGPVEVILSKRKPGPMTVIRVPVAIDIPAREMVDFLVKNFDGALESIADHCMGEVDLQTIRAALRETVINILLAASAGDEGTPQ